MRKSVLTKLICIYLLMAVLLIGVLGFTLARSCRQELLNLRMREITERVQAAGQLAADKMFNKNDTVAMGFLQSIADEYDGVLQIADSKGDVIIELDGRATGVTFIGKSLKKELVEYVLGGRVYTLASYYNADYDDVMSTAVVPVYDSYKKENVVYMAVLHASDAPVQNTFLSLLSRFWIPCLVIIILCVVLIVFLNYGITMPLVEMNSAAKEIARGNFAKRVQVSSADEVGQLANSFNSMAAELAVTDAKRTEFISNISHELRTPLTSINGFVQGILDGTIPQSEQRKYLEIVLAESNRLSRLTREMLELSRIESGRYPIKISPFDVNELLRRVIITEEAKLDDKQLELDVNFEQDRCMVLADAESIEQVCVNLLDNAIKFTDAGGTIGISSKTVDNKVYIAISDTGKGISEADLPHIWDRFYTENKARTGNGGMGLGLSIVKRVLTEHKQDITVTSQQGQGTCFTFTLDTAKQKKNANINNQHHMGEIE